MSVEILEFTKCIPLTINMFDFHRVARFDEIDILAMLCCWCIVKKCSLMIQLVWRIELRPIQN